MKKEILMLIIGILIGAIIATGVFLVLKNDNTSAKGMPENFSGSMEDEDFRTDRKNRENFDAENSQVTSEDGETNESDN